MNKKKYIQPSMEVVKIEQQLSLMAGSETPKSYSVRRGSPTFIEDDDEIL